jgi:hypothetical protein
LEDFVDGFRMHVLQKRVASDEVAFKRYEFVGFDLFKCFGVGLELFFEGFYFFDIGLGLGLATDEQQPNEQNLQERAYFGNHGLLFEWCAKIRILPETLLSWHKKSRPS